MSTLDPSIRVDIINDLCGLTGYSSDESLPMDDAVTALFRSGWLADWVYDRDEDPA